MKKTCYGCKALLLDIIYKCRLGYKTTSNGKPMTDKTIDIYVEHTPEHYTGNVSVTITCRPSEDAIIAYDIICALLDAAGTAILPYKVRDMRNEQ